MVTSTLPLWHQKTPWGWFCKPSNRIHTSLRRKLQTSAGETLGVHEDRGDPVVHSLRIVISFQKRVSHGPWYRSPAAVYLALVFQVSSHFSGELCTWSCSSAAFPSLISNTQFFCQNGLASALKYPQRAGVRISNIYSIWSESPLNYVNSGVVQFFAGESSFKLHTLSFLEAQTAEQNQADMLCECTGIKMCMARQQNQLSAYCDFCLGLFDSTTFSLV